MVYSPAGCAVDSCDGEASAGVDGVEVSDGAELAGTDELACVDVVSVVPPDEACEEDDWVEVVVVPVGRDEAEVPVCPATRLEPAAAEDEEASVCPFSEETGKEESAPLLDTVLLKFGLVIPFLVYQICGYSGLGLSAASSVA